MGSLAAGGSEALKRPNWYDISGRFAEPRHCLASFLALESAEVLEGVKPANLVNLPNRVRPCGRNLYTLWRSEGRQVLAESGLAARELADRGDSLLLLLYSPAAIEELLRGPAAAGVLRRSGYGALNDADATLEELAGRCGGSGFPHEIGVFLGYPLKDVAAFMGWVQLPFACQTLWKVYGDPRPSLELAETFLCCRRQMARRLARCDDPRACLTASRTSKALFLPPASEKENQNPVHPCASH
jgi:hypothetical protein